MVDVGSKPAQRRVARAEGRVRMLPATVVALRDHALPKGDVLTVAKVAAIQAAKRTDELIRFRGSLPFEEVKRRYLNRGFVGATPESEKYSFEEIVRFLRNDFAPLLLRMRTFLEGKHMFNKDQERTVSDMMAGMGEMRERLLKSLDSEVVHVFASSIVRESLLEASSLSSAPTLYHWHALRTLASVVVVEGLLLLISIGASSIAMHLASKWEEKAFFNRNDARVEDEKLITEEREEIKRQKIAVLESIGEEDREFIREYRNLGERGAKSWDDIAREFAPVSRNDVNQAEMDDALTKLGDASAFSEGEMEARDMYWSDNEGDGISDTFYE